MKIICKRFVSALLAVMMLGTVMLSTCAAAGPGRASDYFASTEVWCTPKGNGKFLVEYDIVATRTMDVLGVYSITVYEQQANGSYSSVRVYNWDNTTGLTQTDTGSADGFVWYQGVAGVKYYASLGLYAKKDGTSSTLPQTTRVITPY